MPQWHYWISCEKCIKGIRVDVSFRMGGSFRMHRNDAIRLTCVASIHWAVRISGAKDYKSNRKTAKQIYAIQTSFANSLQIAINLFA